MTARRTVAALDIDGVVADVRHRLHLVQPGTWAEFFAAAPDDPLLPTGAAVAERLAQHHDIVWLTGRPEHTRAATAAWLASHGLPGGALLMHPERAIDPRPTRAIKREHVAELENAGSRVVVVVDDDPRIVDAFRADGVHCLLATWCPYSPTYQDLDARR